MTTLSLASVLAESARRRPQSPAIVQGDRRLTYDQTWQLARRVAAGLRERGIEPGDRVALLAPNTVEFVSGYYGILAAGATVVPVPSMLQPSEAAFLLQHSGAKALIHHAALAQVAQDAAVKAHIPTWDAVALAEAEPLARLVTRSADDVAVIFYTSGTTGRPKGAKLSHLNLVMNATVAAFDTSERSSDEVTMGSLPLFHVYGQSSGLNATFRAGGTIVLEPRFDPLTSLQTMVRERATIFLGVPTMFVFLLQAVDQARAAGQPIELPSLKECFSGGAALPVAVLERFEDVFDTVIYEGYGLSETSPTATCNQVWFGARAGTVGHPVWGVEVEVANAHVTDRIELLPTGERGEVVVRGHNVFAGYVDDDAATDLVMVQGWFRTGDIGVKSDTGALRIVDRTKDLIIRGGFNVYPREVEDVLSRHPCVGQVAVIGVPDDERGEEICAVVVPAQGASVDPEDLIAWSREHLSHHKHPRRIEVVPALPMGPSMKVLKRELRTRFS